MRGTFQLYIEFVNKLLLPKPKKRIVASASNMYLMESLSKMEEINLLTIILEHIRKIVTKKDGKHINGIRLPT